MAADSGKIEGRSGFRGALRALARRFRDRALPPEAQAGKTVRDDGIPALREISAKAAMENTRFSGRARSHPRAGDPRVVNGLLLPQAFPRFTLKPGSTVFTIGSCFAREIEENLPEFQLPTRGFHLGPDLVDGRPNSILNEYNAASMAQRIEWAIGGRDTAQIEGVVSGAGDKVTDLILSKGHPAAPETILEIRRQIDGIYSALLNADAVILTLGMTEVWRDNERGIYLNRLPHPRELQRDPARYSFVNMGAPAVYAHMAQAIERLSGQGVRKILLTVSPVPLASTFEPRDCVVANAYSKATLRIVADMLRDDFPQVDYFPSYEIVLSGGLASYQDDHIHVRREVVAQIMTYMRQHYIDG